MAVYIKCVKNCAVLLLLVRSFFASASLYTLRKLQMFVLTADLPSVCLGKVAMYFPVGIVYFYDKILASWVHY